jgi:hypothetical protein
MVPYEPELLADEQYVDCVSSPRSANNTLISHGSEPIYINGGKHPSQPVHRRDVRHIPQCKGGSSLNFLLKPFSRCAAFDLPEGVYLLQDTCVGDGDSSLNRLRL